MSYAQRHILPQNLRVLESLGTDIRTARLRRNLTAEQVAERAGLSRLTVHRIEQGSPSVAIGSYLQVLVVLGLQDGLAGAASVDVLGRKLQDLGLSAKKRVSKKRINSNATASTRADRSG